MRLPTFAYLRPGSLEEAVAALAGERNARVLAGGQTMLNALKHRVVAPDLLVDVSRLEELRQIRPDHDGSVAIGAAVVYAEVAGSEAVREHHGVAAAMCARLVDRQVRARGTVGGNVCLADPTSNWPPLLVALDATLRVRGPAGDREVRARDWVLAPYITALGPGEVLVEIVLPPLADDERVGYQSLQLGTDSWALARACCRLSRDDSITSAAVVLGCGSVPVRQPALESALVGVHVDDEGAVAAAVDALGGEDFDPPGDVHASTAYRLRMGKVMARRAVLEAVGGRG